ncbi:MAG: hypothetical protein IKH78_02870 [Ruminococcus sp.]|nr:hypothetical protein [Ruminococcus sp.]
MDEKNIKKTAGRRIRKEPSLSVRGPKRQGSLGSRLTSPVADHADEPVHSDSHRDTHTDSPHIDVPLPDKVGPDIDISDAIIKKLKGKNIMYVSKRLTKKELLSLAACEVTVKGRYLIVPDEKVLQVRAILGIKE